MSIPIGLKGRADETVTAENTARAACSGALPVFGTPYMIALMETAAWASIQPHLEPGDSTVGSTVEVRHLSATPIGCKVWAETEVTKVEGKRVFLNVAAYDAAGLIGEGTHERYIVTDERFLAKTARKGQG